MVSLLVISDMVSMNYSDINAVQTIAPDFLISCLLRVRHRDLIILSLFQSIGKEAEALRGLPVSK